MATVFNQFDPDDQQDEKTPGQGTNPSFEAAAPTVGGAQGGGVITPGPTGTSSGGGTSSGRFNNLQKYLTANKDFKAEQGGLAGGIVGNINQRAQNVQKNVQGAGQAFKQQSQQAINTFNNPELANQAFTDPTQFVQDQNKLQQFQAIRDAKYGGPQSLQDLSGEQNLAKLQGQSAEVGDLIKQGQSESGRFNLLKTMYGKPSYTAGQQNLDNLLLQSNREQLNKIQGARQIATGTNRALTQTEQQAQQQAAQAQKLAGDVQTDVRSRLNQSVMGEQEEINARIPEAIAAQQAATQAFGQSLQSGVIKPEDLQRLAAQYPELKEGMNLYNVDATPFISAQGTPTAQSIATQADYDKFNALKTLIGNTANEQASSTLAAFNNPELAGSFASGPQYGLDVNRYLNAVQAAGGEYKTSADEYQGAIGQAKAALTGGDPSMPYQGGQLGEVARRAATIREKLTANQLSPELSAQLGIPYEDYSMLSDIDLLAKHGAQDDIVGHDRWLTQGVASNQRKEAEYQAKLKQLQDMYQYGKVLTTDPNKAYQMPEAPGARH